MAQQQSPWLEGAYGWNFGEGGWNTGMDSNLLKFSFLFDRNVDSIVASLPSAVNGQAHYLTTDNRLYFAVGTTYFSTPVPKWFTIIVRGTGQTHQFNGTSLIQTDNPVQIDSRLDSVEVTVSSLGTAAFEDTEFFATQADLDVAEADAATYTDALEQEILTGSGTGVGYASITSPSTQRTVRAKLDEIITPADSGGKAGPILEVLEGNWTAEQGGRVYFFNPDSVDIQSTLKNSIVVLGGRGDTGYRVTVGPNAELAFHGGGGDTLLDHLAGTICGGAHHIMTKNNIGEGSHGFIGGGSFQEVYGDYCFIGGGTLNKNHAIKATIVGGDSNRIGVITDQQVGRNSFVGGGYLNTVDGKYAWVPSGQLCKAQKDYSSAWGFSSTSNLYGTMANSSGSFTTAGDNNTLRGKLRRTTTNTTATQLLLDGSSQTLTMGSNSLWTGRVLISAYRTDAAETASYSLTFSAVADGAAVVTIKSSSLTVLHEDNAAYNVDVIASASTVQIRAIGVASSNIRWSASFEIDEVRNI